MKKYGLRLLVGLSAFAIGVRAVIVSVNLETEQVCQGPELTNRKNLALRERTEELDLTSQRTISGNKYLIKNAPDILKFETNH